MNAPNLKSSYKRGDYLSIWYAPIAKSLLGMQKQQQYKATVIIFMHTMGLFVSALRRSSSFCPSDAVSGAIFVRVWFQEQGRAGANLLGMWAIEEWLAGASRSSPKQALYNLVRNFLFYRLTVKLSTKTTIHLSILELTTPLPSHENATWVVPRPRAAERLPPTKIFVFHRSRTPSMLLLLLDP